MKKDNGITLVALVITIIVLIILAGISINLILGDNGIITKAKQAKENMEFVKIEEETVLNELYMQIEAEGASPGSPEYDTIVKLTEFKKAIADYIGEVAPNIKPEYTADANTFGKSIKAIVTEVTKDATATESDITEGKTAWVNGEQIIGIASGNSFEYVTFHSRPTNTSSCSASVKAEIGKTYYMYVSYGNVGNGSSSDLGITPISAFNITGATINETLKSYILAGDNDVVNKLYKITATSTSITLKHTLANQNSYIWISGMLIDT